MPWRQGALFSSAELTWRRMPALRFTPSLLLLLLCLAGLMLPRGAALSLRRALPRRLLLTSSRMSTTGAGGGETKTWALTYDYVADILEKRAPFREAHIKLATDLKDQGVIVSGGPLLEGASPTGALFLFRSPSRSVVEAFVAKDPYVSAKLVVAHRIQEYSVVVGSLQSKL